jgi:hypothetical protein
LNNKRLDKVFQSLIERQYEKELDALVKPPKELLTERQKDLLRKRLKEIKNAVIEK